MKTWNKTSSASNENAELINMVAEDIKDCVSEQIFISDIDATRYVRKSLLV